MARTLRSAINEALSMGRNAVAAAAGESKLRHLPRCNTSCPRNTAELCNRLSHFVHVYQNHSRKFRQKRMSEVIRVPERTNNKCANVRVNATYDSPRH